MINKIFIYAGNVFIGFGLLLLIKNLLPKKWMRKKITLEKWQLVSLIFGFILIIAGLIVIIFWQRGFIQLKWLQCPELEIPFA